MDTSEKYIKMCEKAQEIQDLRKLDNGEGSPYLKEGDYFCKLTSTNVELFKNKTSYILIDIVWLPRQDQLQDIVINKTNNFGSNNLSSQLLLNNIVGFSKELYCSRKKEMFSTLEQLWLAFVMKTIYNKIWNEETQNWKEIKWLRMQY